MMNTASTQRARTRVTNYGATAQGNVSAHTAGLRNSDIKLATMAAVFGASNLSRNPGLYSDANAGLLSEQRLQENQIALASMENSILDLHTVMEGLKEQRASILKDYKEKRASLFFFGWFASSNRQAYRDERRRLLAELREIKSEIKKEAASLAALQEKRTALLKQEKVLIKQQLSLEESDLETTGCCGFFARWQARRRLDRKAAVKAFQLFNKRLYSPLEPDQASDIGSMHSGRSRSTLESFIDADELLTPENLIHVQADVEPNANIASDDDDNQSVHSAGSSASSTSSAEDLSAFAAAFPAQPDDQPSAAPAPAPSAAPSPAPRATPSTTASAAPAPAPRAAPSPTTPSTASSFASQVSGATAAQVDDGVFMPPTADPRSAERAKLVNIDLLENYMADSQLLKAATVSDLLSVFHLRDKAGLAKEELTSILNKRLRVTQLKFHPDKYSLPIKYMQTISQIGSMLKEKMHEEDKCGDIVDGFAASDYDVNLIQVKPNDFLPAGHAEVHRSLEYMMRFVRPHEWSSSDPQWFMPLRYMISLMPPEHSGPNSHIPVYKFVSWSHYIHYDFEKNQTVGTNPTDETLYHAFVRAYESKHGKLDFSLPSTLSGVLNVPKLTELFGHHMKISKASLADLSAVFFAQTDNLRESAFCGKTGRFKAAFAEQKLKEALTLCEGSPAVFKETLVAIMKEIEQRVSSLDQEMRDLEAMVNHARPQEWFPGHRDSWFLPMSYLKKMDDSATGRTSYQFASVDDFMACKNLLNLHRVDFSEDIITLAQRAYKQRTGLEIEAKLPSKDENKRRLNLEALLPLLRNPNYIAESSIDRLLDVFHFHNLSPLLNADDSLNVAELQKVLQESKESCAGCHPMFAQALELIAAEIQNKFDDALPLYQQKVMRSREDERVRVELEARLRAEEAQRQTSS